jgi:hypothetical protein
MWFDLAASAGTQDSLEDGDAVKRRMTPSQIAEAQNLARE